MLCGHGWSVGRLRLSAQPQVLAMTVAPGFGGQPFRGHVLQDKVRPLRAACPTLDIQVRDGIREGHRFAAVLEPFGFSCAEDIMASWQPLPQLAGSSAQPTHPSATVCWRTWSGVLPSNPPCPPCRWTAASTPRPRRRLLLPAPTCWWRAASCTATQRCEIGGAARMQAGRPRTVPKETRLRMPLSVSEEAGD